MTIRRDNLDRRISDQIADEAGFWDARLRAPDCTGVDRAEFAAWREKDPAHRAAFEQLQTVVAALRNEGSRADVRALRDAALRITKKSHAQKFTFAVAASLATLAIAATIWTTLPDGAGRVPLRKLAAITARIAGLGSELANTYETGIGQTSTIALQDGSSVELNAKSRIKVAFNESRREVELVDGQAFFHVARNPQRPFVVRAGNRDIVAIGTAFDVRLDEKSVKVTLIEGKVAVSRQSVPSTAAEQDRIATSASAQEAGTRDEGAQGKAADPSLSALEDREGKGQRSSSRLRVACDGRVAKEGRSGISAEQDCSAERGAGRADEAREASSGSGEIFLAPGQQLVALLPAAGDVARREYEGSTGHSQAGMGADTVLVRNIDVAKVTGWRDGRVFLEDLTLADAVAEMNRHSPVQISLIDPKLATLRVNGMFRAGEQQAFVAALEQYFPITAEHHGDAQIVLIPR
jgi:ferric-dicitrate binding protein FerR (iron transport regulator)